MADQPESSWDQIQIDLGRSGNRGEGDLSCCEHRPTSVQDDSGSVSFNISDDDANRISNHGLADEEAQCHGSRNADEGAPACNANGNGSPLSCQQHGYGSFPYYPANSDETLSAAIGALEPCFHGESTIRGQLRSRQKGTATSRIRSKERSDSRRNDRNKRDKSQNFQSFQVAVDVHDWQIAESLIPFADVQRLNDGLCIVLDCVWFLDSQDEVHGAIRLIEKLVEAGAKDFTRAVLRTSFLASCVSACGNKPFRIVDMVSLLEERLSERLQECSGHEISKAEAAAKIRKFAEWALKCIASHSRIQKRDVDGQGAQSLCVESQFQLKAFKRFLDLAGNRLTGNDYTEAFDAACFPLTLFSSFIESGWASGVGSTAMQGLLGMLVEGGADNVSQSCLEAARFGSTDLLRILLQIAHRNGIEVDLDLALEYASHFCKLRTMECLVDEWNASSFLGPLMRAADRGCMPVVRWFVERECRDMELCSALVASTSSCKFEVTDYLLKCIPLHVLRTRSIDILTAIGDRSAGCLSGVAFLLRSNFLGTPEATYAAADNISNLDDQFLPSGLKVFCKTYWSSEAFLHGCEAGEDHYLNVIRAINCGSSPLQLQELPMELQVAVAYFPLYKECAATPGILLSQWLRGQLVVAVLRLHSGKSMSTEDLMNKEKLLAILELRLPS